LWSVELPDPDALRIPLPANLASMVRVTSGSSAGRDSLPENRGGSHVDFDI
jgi:hypothetical protein